MRKSLLLALVCATLLAACGGAAPSTSQPVIVVTVISVTATPQPTNPPPATATPQPAPANFTVVLQPNARANAKTDVFLKDVKTGEQKLFATLDNVYRDHYHAAEYHNGHVYIVLRKGDPGTNPNWSDELWRYDSTGQGVLVYAMQGLDFRTAPDESYTAIPAFGTDANGKSFSKMVFIDAQGKVVKEVNYSPEGNDNPYSSDGQWADNSQIFWGAGQIGPQKEFAFSITPGSWEFDIYPMTGLPQGREGALNANVGKIILSDYPFFFDGDSAQKFTDSKQTVTLYVYDFRTKQLDVITTSAAKIFDAKWLSDNSIEYNDPNSTGRLVYKLP
jgi:hypothetical protein